VSSTVAVAEGADKVGVASTVGVCAGALVAVGCASVVAVAAGATVGVGLGAGPPHAAMVAASAEQATQANMRRAALRGVAVLFIAHLSPVI
jgi:hypothetical protein